MIEGRRVLTAKNKIGPRYSRFRIDAHTGEVRLLWGIEWLPAREADARSCGTTLAALRDELTETEEGTDA